MSIAIVWFRKDLRTADNPALKAACCRHEKILPLYILDRETSLDIGAAQGWWLFHSLKSLSYDLKQHEIDLILKKGNAAKIFQTLVKQYKITDVYWNRCYEPAMIERDKKIKAQLKEAGLAVHGFKGSLLNEPWEIKNQSGSDFKVFTPYWKQCLKQMSVTVSEPVSLWPKSLAMETERLEDWDLLPNQPDWARKFSAHWRPGEQAAFDTLDDFIENQLAEYKQQRDIPAKQATSRLSPHLHFGEISPAQIWQTIHQSMMENPHHIKSAEKFLSELGWREFSYHLLYHRPDMPDVNFNDKFDAFPWRDNQQDLERWQKGQTGYPIVDAGMRELWQTGYMHNRVRMIVASFLCKDLLIDWRQGAAWFQDTLLDADVANNSANWQWVAGSGADAAPYFRVFNPVLQSERFDPQGEYIKQWLPELSSLAAKWIHKPWEAPVKDLTFERGKEYPQPMVDHQKARKQALSLYQSLKKKATE